MQIAPLFGQKVKKNWRPSWWRWKMRMKKLAWNNIQKSKIMASVHIISWQIDGEKLETVTDFIFLGSKIIVDYDCSHKTKKHLLLGRKAMTNLGTVLNSRDITLPSKVHIVKAVNFRRQWSTGKDLRCCSSWGPKEL